MVWKWRWNNERLFFAVKRNWQRSRHVQHLVFIPGTLWFVMGLMWWNLHWWLSLNGWLSKTLCIARERKRKKQTNKEQKNLSKRLTAFSTKLWFKTPLEMILKQILDITVDMINFMKQRPLKYRMFPSLCENMQKDNVTLLLHTEARWLSRDKVLTRVLELRQELLFASKKIIKPISVNVLNLQIGQMNLAYLADIQHLHNLNTSM